MDILADMLERVRLNGTLLFHYELGCPWGVALPQFPDAVFHYLSRGLAIVELQDGRMLRMDPGDFVLLARGQPHVLRSDRRTKPFPLSDLDPRPAHLGIVRHGGEEEPYSTMICGYFSLSRPSRSSVLELLPPILRLSPAAEQDWLETILQRMVRESAIHRPGQGAVLSRMTEMLFIEVLRSWMKSLGPGEGGWLGGIADPHIGMALQLIHEQPERHWTLRDLGSSVGLGRSAFSERFTKLVGQPMHGYLIAHRMEVAASLLASSEEGIARIAARVGYEAAAAFSKLFYRHHGLSPGRYRSDRKSDNESKAR